MQNLLEIEELKSGYKNREILHGVSFKIQSGELLGIIGPNGSGKTTLLRSLTSILKPLSGTIRLDGKNLSKLSYKEIARSVAVVSQSIDSVVMTVSDYILMGRLPYFGNFQFFEKSRDLEIVEEYMKLTGIFELKDKLLSELSGGERQRSQIARALAQEPSVLLLDEPTSHLDITHQIKVLDLIKKLNRKLKLTVIMVIHDLNLASEYCTRLLMLKNGIIHKDGDPESVLTYRDIEDVYGTVVIVKQNPLSGKPFVIPVSEEVKTKKFNKIT